VKYYHDISSKQGNFSNTLTKLTKKTKNKKQKTKNKKQKENNMKNYEYLNILKALSAGLERAYGGENEELVFINAIDTLTYHYKNKIKSSLNDVKVENDNV